MKWKSDQAINFFKWEVGWQKRNYNLQPITPTTVLRSWMLVSTTTFDDECVMDILVDLTPASTLQWIVCTIFTKFSHEQLRVTFTGNTKKHAYNFECISRWIFHISSESKVSPHIPQLNIWFCMCVSIWASSCAPLAYTKIQIRNNYTQVLDVLPFAPHTLIADFTAIRDISSMYFIHVSN